MTTTLKLSKKKVKTKSSWMKGFILCKPLDDLAKAQIESRTKIMNDFKKKINRR